MNTKFPLILTFLIFLFPLSGKTQTFSKIEDDSSSLTKDTPAVIPSHWSIAKRKKILKKLRESGKTNLKGQDFSSISFNRGDFKGQDLRETKWSNTVILSGDFTNANLQNASMGFANFNYVNFGGADLRGTILPKTRYNGGSIYGGGFNGAILNNESDLGDILHKIPDGEEVIFNGIKTSMNVYKAYVEKKKKENENNLIKIMELNNDQQPPQTSCPPIAQGLPIGDSGLLEEFGLILKNNLATKTPEEISAIKVLLRSNDPSCKRAAFLSLCP